MTSMHRRAALLAAALLHEIFAFLQSMSYCILQTEIYGATSEFYQQSNDRR